MSDDKFRNNLHKAFTSISNDIRNKKLPKEVVAKELESFNTGLNTKFGYKNASVKNIYKSWVDSGKNFEYIESNPYDITVRKSENFGYDWLMDMTDDELSKRISASENLRKKYDLSTVEGEMETLIRSHHASAKKSGTLSENTRLKSGTKKDTPFYTNVKTSPSIYGEALFAIGQKDPEVGTVLNYIKGQSDSLENIIDELRQSGLFPSEVEEDFQKVAKKRAKAHNINKLSVAPEGELSVLESLRYIDNERDLSTYMTLTHNEKNDMIVPRKKKAPDLNN